MTSIRIKPGMIVLSLWTAGCAVAEPSGPEACRALAAYTGPPMRDDLTLSALTRAAANQSGLSSSEVLRLDTAFDAAFGATNARSMTAAVWQGGGESWTMQQGASQAQLHYWASVGKIITALTVMQLDATGRLSLDDPISAFVGDVPNGDRITLRMLLNHTSGLFSANEDPRQQARRGPLTLSEELEILARRGPYSCPGAIWRYSNSGYALLGAVIEEVTGHPYHVAATDLVLSRSRARGLRMVAPDDPLDDTVPLAGPAEPTAFQPTYAQAAGGLVADAGSMSVLLQDIFSGRIVPEGQLHEMVDDLFPMGGPGLWYGLGVMVYDVPGERGPTTWIGHSGGVAGGRAVIAYVPSRHAIVAVAFTGEGSAEATANLLISALDQD